MEVLDLDANGRLSLVIDEAWQSRGLGARRGGAIRREFSSELLLEAFDPHGRDVAHTPQHVHRPGDECNTYDGRRQIRSRGERRKQAGTVTIFLEKQMPDGRDGIARA